MKMFCSMATVTGWAMGMASTLAAGDAHAVTQARNFHTNSPAICQPASPLFDHSIRKRPLAVQNEGTRHAFVTCSLITQGGSITRVGMWASAFDDASHTLSCTGVTGYNTGPNFVAVKTIQISASGPPDVAIVWQAEDFGSGRVVFPSHLFSVSCSLPPGVSLNDMYVEFSEDVGN